MKRKNIFLFFMFFIFIQAGYTFNMDSISQLFPSSLNGWYRSDTVQQIDSSNIFAIDSTT